MGIFALFCIVLIILMYCISSYHCNVILGWLATAYAGIQFLTFCFYGLATLTHGSMAIVWLFQLVALWFFGSFCKLAYISFGGK